MGDEPILWALLGNTAANFEDDLELIERITTLLRPQDLLMLEVATSTELAGDVPERVSTEYLRSKAFCEFVTSALHQHTDLPINMDNVAISGEVVDDRCVVIKTTYHHRDEDTRVTLPDRTVITLKNGDTIRLYISRKYAPAALHGELGRSVWGSRAPPTPPGPRGKQYRFGLQLMLLSKDLETISPRSAAHGLFRDADEPCSPQWQLMNLLAAVAGGRSAPAPS